MADELVAMQLSMSADLRSFKKSMDGMRAAADRRLTEVEKRALMADRRLSRTMDQAGRNMTAALKNSLTGIAPVIAGAFSAAAVLKYADAYTALQNRLKAAGLEGAALKKVEDSLYQAANRNGVAVEATAELYQRAAMARNNLGASEEQLLALVSGTSAALKLQGTSAGEASGALLQLGQILGGEKVQAQEYNSLIDQLPVLLQAAADGSGKFGGEISILTQQVKAGKVTTQEFFTALLKGLGDIETRAAAATPTVGAAFTTLNNEIGRFVGQTDQGLSATQRMAQAIIALSENLGTVALVAGAVATLMGGRFVLAMTAGSGGMIAGTISSIRYQVALAGLAARQAGVTTATVLATGATQAFSAAIAANPIGFAIVAVAALAAGLIYLSKTQSDAAVTARAQAQAHADAQPATTALEGLVRDLAGANDQETASIRRKISALLDEQRVKAQMARNAFLEAKADERARVTTAYETADRYGSPLPTDGYGNALPRPGGIGPNGNPVDVIETPQLRELRATAEAVEESYARLKETAEPAAPPRVATPAPTATGTRGRGGGGPSPEELARQRELLDLQAEIALLRAQDRTAEADAKQDQLDVLTLTKQFDEAGFANAKAKAEAQVAALATARTAAQVAEETKRQAEGEARAIEMTRGFVLDMLGVQEQIALTDQDALAIRREILSIRQAERRAALEAAAADKDATDAERQAARAALANLPRLESGEGRELEGSTGGARDAQDIARNLNPYANAVERAREAYAEIDRLRQEDKLSEEEAARAKAQVDVDLREQRLSGTRTMLDTLASLQNSSNKKLAALGKAAAIAQATIDGVLAVQKALASAPPPFNFIQAAVVGAVAAANVASIAGMADGGMVGGSGGPRQDNQLRWLSTGEFVNNAASVRRNRPFLEAANDGADLSQLIPGLANGGLVGRVNATAGQVSAAVSRESSSAFTFAPVINAPGADRQGLREVREHLTDLERNFAGRVNSVRERRAKYRKGGR